MPKEKMRNYYYGIVVNIARVEDSPDLSWEVCKRCAEYFFKIAGKSLDSLILKECWDDFSKASGGRLYRKSPRA